MPSELGIYAQVLACQKRDALLVLQLRGQPEPESRKENKTAKPPNALFCKKKQQSLNNNRKTPLS